MKKDSINSVISDKNFLEKIIELRSIEEVKKAFKERGITFSGEDIEIMGKMIKFQIENSQKISESQLEKTVGGLSDEDLKRIKNITITLSAIAVAVSAIYAANNLKSTTENVDKTTNVIKKSWLMKLFGG